MKPTLNLKSPDRAASESFASRGHSPALSPLTAARQAIATPSLRVPVVRQNRDYLKALRQAELASWVAAKPAQPIRRPLTATPRLPLPVRDPQENRVYAFLAVLCLLAIGYELWGLMESAGHWHHFVQFVRQILA